MKWWTDLQVTLTTPTRKNILKPLKLFQLDLNRSFGSTKLLIFDNSFYKAVIIVCG